MASKNKNLAELLDANGDVLLTNLDNVSVTPTAVSDQPNTSTGGFSVPAGTTAQRPSSPDSGETRFNTDDGSLEFWDGANWVRTNLIPEITSVTGTIYAGISTTLTLAVTKVTDTIDVVFSESGSEVATVTGVTVTAGSASVNVPAAVYGQTDGDTIVITVKNEDSTPSANSVSKIVQGLPTGGTITTSGDYRIHTFTSSGTFTVPSGLTLSDVEYLVIAGGGGGGGRNVGGGGGAGGYRTSVVGQTSGGGGSAESRLTLTAGSYTATVGAGGAGGANGTNEQPGIQGSNSVFSTITSIGGGFGDHGVPPNANNAGGSGGSGGGGGGQDNTTTSSGGSGTSNQGYAGGGTASPTPNGGGGGGAGAAGSAGTTSGAGNGGAGVSSNITGSSVTRAGGGGGGGNDYGGAGGSGGGGAGGYGGSGSSVNPVGVEGADASVNTGSGGGGSRGWNTGDGGGAGGSGVVIVRYDTTAL